jgi:serralysin
MITGDGGSNFLRGFSGNDTLIGGSGIDFLQGDAGVDVLDGGAGTDWAYYLSAKTDLTIDLSNSANNTGEAAGDTYISIESVLGGRFNDTITGDAGDNYLRGFTGDDIITGGAGNDTLRGDAGADTFVFVTGTGSDTVIDYNDADDMLDFSNFGFTDVNDALSNAADVNGDVVFTIGSDVITIEDTTVNDIMDNMIV